MKTFKLNLTQKSPACFANTRHKQNIYYTHDYIPGSVLWGYFIKRYTAPGKKIHKDFFNHKIKFSNCYLEIDKQTTIPAPLSLHSCKKDPYNRAEYENTGHALFDLMFENLEKCPSEKCDSDLRPIKHDYIYLRDNKIAFYKPRKFVEMHNSIHKTSQNTKDECLFAYELLDECIENKDGRIKSKDEHLFYGYIHVDETSDLLDFILGFPQNEEIELGKARTSGCGIFELEIKETNLNDTSIFKPWVLFDHNFNDKNGYLNIYCYSDVILMDAHNRYQTLITPEMLRLEGKIKLERSFAKFHKLEGFNACHQKTKTIDYAIRKGSCFKYKIENTADKKNMMYIRQRICEIERNGLGMRLNEGFGQVFFNRTHRSDSKISPNPTNNRGSGPNFKTGDGKRQHKAECINKIFEDWNPFLPREINSLPSFSGLKPIISQLLSVAEENLDETKRKVTELIGKKSVQKRKFQWTHGKFNEELDKKINSIDKAIDMQNYFFNFLEYYRLLKCENKND